MLVFGRRLHLASDDLLLPAAVGTLTHAAHLLLAAAAAFSSVAQPSLLLFPCSRPDWLRTYLAVSIATDMALATINSLIAWLSLRGS
ncbi:hypothetical protein HK405_001944, partial [Cladochytrium tenue]